MSELSLFFCAENLTYCWNDLGVLEDSVGKWVRRSISFKKVGSLYLKLHPSLECSLRSLGESNEAKGLSSSSFIGIGKG
jgi:hypothetical protein